MLSPPTSVSGSEGERDREPVAEDSHSSPVETAVATVAAAGTFLVKEGEDNHGKAFPKNPFQKDIFSALALEKMFEPPSPPPAGSSNAALETVAEASPSTSENERSASGSESAHTTPSSVKFNQSPSPISASPSSEVSSPSSARSSTPGTSSSSHTVSIQRRASHQYAPVNPSRLSKSVTPSDASFATTTEATHESMNESVPAITVDEGTVVANALGDEPSIDTLTDDYGTLDPTEEVVEDEETGTVRGVSSENPSPERELFAEQTSPFTTHSRYPFTFTAPSRQNSSEEPVFDPSLAPLQDGQPSSSTLRNRPPSGGLRLFRSTYDTYTREQLSALVDSIAVQQSPSPPPILPTRAAQWSPADSESPLRSDSSGSASTPASGSSADVRRAKRLRVSPPSPQGRPARAPSVRGPGMIRDWQAHGRALMDRIRVTDPELSASATSASRTDSWGSRDSTPLEDRTRERGTPMSEGISGYSEFTSVYVN
jgi:hypothetical protein